jgi:tRNA threonylcarbamoyladenosine biosynthesis protein TsaB
VVVPGAWTGDNVPLSVAGRGFRAYPQLLNLIELRGGAVHEALLPRAQEVARLAVPEVQAGRTLPPEQAIPVYLRDDVARPQSRN